MRRFNLTILPLFFFFVACSDQPEQSPIDGSLKEKVYSSMEEEAKALALPISELNSLSKSEKRQRAAAVILADYVVLKDSSYHLDISKEHAKSIGVDGESYERVKKDLELSNKAIKDALKVGEKLYLPDIKKEAKEYKEKKDTSSLSESTRAVSSLYFQPGYRRQEGRIYTYNSNIGRDYFRPALMKKVVRFICITNAALVPVYLCGTHTFGVTYTKSKAGSLFHNTEMWVRLAASGSNIAGGVFFATSDSRGGKCYWKAWE
ncbi:MAG: hypothetical protein ACFNM7_05155 [Prevotella conceptionensis]